MPVALTVGDVPSDDSFHQSRPVGLRNQALVGLENRLFFIGATLEKRRWMDNEAVNFLNTLIGSGVAIGGFRWLA